MAASAPTSGADRELGAGFFGASVALSADGNTALVGARSNNAGVGSAIAFTRKGTAWTNQQTLLAPTSGPDKGILAANFGAGVALSADGSTALVGAPFNNPSGSIAGVGSAIVFTRTATGWIIQQTLRAPTSGTNKELNPGNFGASVALNADGNTALVGAPGDDLTGAFQTGVGAAWVFAREARTWDGGQKLVAPTSGSEEEIASTLWGKGQFGWSVALSSDGKTALIGGQNDNGEVGAAWVFIYQPAFLHRVAGWYVTQKLTAPATGPARMNGTANFGGAVALSGDGTTALIGGRLDDAAEVGGEAGAAWILAPLSPPHVPHHDPRGLPAASDKRGDLRRRYDVLARQARQAGTRLDRYTSAPRRRAQLYQR